MVLLLKPPNLGKTKVIYKGVMTSVPVQLSKVLDSFWQPVLVTNFLYFNFYNFSTFTNNVGHIWFTIQNFNFLEKKKLYKKCNPEPFCYVIKRVVQLNKCETGPYFLQNFQCTTMFISVFCKSCEPMLCEPEIVQANPRPTDIS